MFLDNYSLKEDSIALCKWEYIYIYKCIALYVQASVSTLVVVYIYYLILHSNSYIWLKCIDDSIDIYFIVLE